MVNIFAKILNSSLLSDKDIESQKKWLLLFLINIFTIVAQSIYIFRFPIEYKIFFPVYVLVPTLLLNFSAFYFLKKKVFIKAALLVLLPTTTNLIFMIFIAGGLNSPGIFGVAIFPLLYSTFFGKKGAIGGACIAFIVYIVFLLLDTFYGNLSFMHISAEQFKIERIMNIAIYTGLTAVYYVSIAYATEKASERLTKANEKVDTLLKVVLHDIAVLLQLAVPAYI